MNLVKVKLGEPRVLCCGRNLLVQTLLPRVWFWLVLDDLDNGQLLKTSVRVLVLKCGDMGRVGAVQTDVVLGIVLLMCDRFSQLGASEIRNLGDVRLGAEGCFEPDARGRTEGVVLLIERGLGNDV